MLQSVSRDHFRCLCCSQSILGMQFLWPQRLLPVVDFVSSSCYLPLEESSLREDWLLLFAYWWLFVWRFEGGVGKWNGSFGTWWLAGGDFDVRLWRLVWEWVLCGLFVIGCCDFAWCFCWCFQSGVTSVFFLSAFGLMYPSLSSLMFVRGCVVDIGLISSLSFFKVLSYTPFALLRWGAFSPFYHIPK